MMMELTMQARKPVTCGTVGQILDSFAPARRAWIACERVPAGPFGLARRRAVRVGVTARQLRGRASFLQHF